MRRCRIPDFFPDLYAAPRMATPPPSGPSVALSSASLRQSVDVSAASDSSSEWSSTSTDDTATPPPAAADDRRSSSAPPRSHRQPPVASSSSTSLPHRNRTGGSRDPVSLSMTAVSAFRRLDPHTAGDDDDHQTATDVSLRLGSPRTPNFAQRNGLQQNAGGGGSGGFRATRVPSTSFVDASERTERTVVIHSESEGASATRRPRWTRMERGEDTTHDGATESTEGSNTHDREYPPQLEEFLATLPAQSRRLVHGHVDSLEADLAMLENRCMKLQQEANWYRAELANRSAAVDRLLQENQEMRAARVEQQHSAVPPAWWATAVTSIRSAVRTELKRAKGDSIRPTSADQSAPTTALV